jgi:hypothetical protein
MRAWLKQVLRELGARGYAAYALVAEPPVPGPFRLPADAIVVAVGPAAHVRLLSEPVRLAWTPEQAAQYITLSIPWTAEEAREQAEEWRHGYTEAGVPVTELS